MQKVPGRPPAESRKFQESAQEDPEGQPNVATMARNCFQKKTEEQ